MTPAFLNIKTMFNDNIKRSIDGLSQVYQDFELLKSLVAELSEGVLSIENLKGKKILLKPNWVKHNYRPNDELCLCTNTNFILAILELVLSKQPASVVIGDAPIQGCNWDKLINKEFLDAVAALTIKYSITVSVKDFRRVAFDTSNNKLEVERNPIDQYVIFDVGKKSYLEPITVAGKNNFRVTVYNPDKFVHTHGPGMHKYCITKELFDSDIVISIPKVKTHQKAGITAALKNIVGLNGDKDFLPHHRIGGIAIGGDSYAGGNKLRYWSELALDNANRNKGKKLYWLWLRLASLLWKISLPGKEHQHAAAWYGNDTTWRMVMDLNIIINYGKADGTLADTPQRFLYSFCDGIIGGQGDGPLRPEPLSLGVISFSNDSATTDIAMATLMNLKINKIPLLTAAKEFMPDRSVEIKLNGETCDLNKLIEYATPTVLPPGWENY